jgi:hypothetical protein
MNNQTLENKALDYYTQYWDVKEPHSKFDTRWEKFVSCFNDGDFVATTEMLRMACAEAYLAGVALRLTEGE